MKKQDFVRGILHGVPICLGYLAVSFGFGIFSAAGGLSILETVLISMTNVTSAGQLAGVPVILTGGSLVELAVAQLVINMRYALMSISLSQKLDSNVKLRHRFLIAFVNTDEVFAVSASQPGHVSKEYMFGLILTPYFGWAFGTALGAIAGNILPQMVITALSVAIYGMFVAIVVPTAKKHLPTALCVLLAIVFSCLFAFVPVLSAVPDGFVIIICAVAASCLFAALRPIPIEEDEKEETV